MSQVFTIIITSTLCIHIEKLANPDDVAVDWINDKLYWVDSLWARIEVMDISVDGSGERAEVVKLSNHTIPRGIAVDPTSRFNSNYYNLVMFTRLCGVIGVVCRIYKAANLVHIVSCETYYGPVEFCTACYTGT